MSYYNYAFTAKKDLPNNFENLVDDYYQTDYLIFKKSDDGFDNLLKYLGEDYLLKEEYIVMEMLKYSYDVIRPSDLNMRILGRESFIGDADCCVPLSMVEDSVDFIETDMNILDEFLKICDTLQTSEDTPVFLYPL